MRAATLVLTIPVVVLLTQPLWAPEWGAGILGEVAAVGPIAGGLTVAAFFGAVALYCLALQRLLEQVPESARGRSTRSIWLMFALPFNFVEDFFIVGAIDRSLAADGRTPPNARRLWAATGLAWCTLQIASLLPGPIGVGTGALALLVWAEHWIHTVLLRRRLAAATSAVPA
ncbi:hypothetical protein [Nocardia asteroides]|uniref:hypothetical protein n=1 Tax=Nocardia asteroides TaxID=1824 RepID=UPI0033ED4EDD